MILFVFAALIVWGLTGLIIAALISRHGHNFVLLAVMGLGYGPLLTLIWLQSSAGQETGCHVVRQVGQTPRRDHCHALVELDGTEGSVASARIVLDAIAPAMGRVEFTSVLDHELFNSADVFEVDEARAAYLERSADELGYPEADLTLISGRRDKALGRHAIKNGFDVIVVGRGRSVFGDWVRGDSLGRLARHVAVPLMIGPPVETTAARQQPVASSDVRIR